MQIPYGKQEITEADIQAVEKVLRSDFLTQGPAIAAFEKAFSEYVRAKYAVAVSNGTAALHLSVLALGIQPGQKVITTPITFVASANCVCYAGGEIELADIDPETYCIDLEAVREKLQNASPREYAGIIPVDFSGYPVNTEALRQLADEHNLWILEDACHAPGGNFMDSKENTIRCGDGTYVDATVFSFHPVKHIAAGEGGMITTNSEEIYQKLVQLRTHGITKDINILQENHGGWYYEMHDLGYNYRLTDLQAALANSQLTLADERLEKRLAIAQRYDEAFEHLGVRKQKVPEGKHAFHLYVVEVEDRKALYNYLRENGIYAQVHYIPVHYMPYHAAVAQKGTLPNAERYYEHCLSLPMYPTLTTEEQAYVIQKVTDFIG